LQSGAGDGIFRGDFAGESLRDGLEIDVEMIGLEQLVLAEVSSFERNPILRTFGQSEFFGGVTGEADARDHGVLEAGAHGSPRFVKISTGKILFERCGARDDTVEFDRGAGGVAGDLQFFGGGAPWACKQKQNSAKTDSRAGSHTNPRGKDGLTDKLPYYYVRKAGK
jgi:hypothetical protein